MRGAGPATKIVIADPALGGFQFGMGQQVTLRDLVIDYDPLPFCQGTIRAVDVGQGAFDLKVAAGIGIVDGLPGIDLDFMAGGMFKDSQQLGGFTETSIESYWIGVGLTWRFGRGTCTNVSAPDSWSCDP